MNNHIVKYQEINTPRGTLRGLLTIPTGEIKNLVVMFHGYTGHKNENGYLFKTTPVIFPPTFSKLFLTFPNVSNFVVL